MEGVQGPEGEPGPAQGFGLLKPSEATGSESFYSLLDLMPADVTL